MFDPRDDGSPGRGMVLDVASLADWELGAADEGWLVSYADMLSVILAMVVLLLGRMVMAGAAAEPLRAGPPSAAGHVVSGAASPDAHALDADDLLVPWPAVSVPLADARAASLSLRQLPSLDLLLAPTLIPLRSAATLSSKAPLPKIDDLDLPLEAETGSRSAAVEAPAPGAGASREQRLAELVEERFAGTVAAQPQDVGVLLTIADVALFGSASAELAPPATQLLMQLAATLREAGEVEVSVEGHTDDQPIQGGRFASNWDLAAARANAVTRFLLAQGFDRSRVHSVSYADTRPVADNGTTAGRAANRRVELRIKFLGNSASS